MGYEQVKLVERKAKKAKRNHRKTALNFQENNYTWLLDLRNRLFTSFFIAIIQASSIFFTVRLQSMDGVSSVFCLCICNLGRKEERKKKEIIPECWQFDWIFFFSLFLIFVNFVFFVFIKCSFSDLPEFFLLFFIFSFRDNEWCQTIMSYTIDAVRVLLSDFILMHFVQLLHLHQTVARKREKKKPQFSK